MAAAANPAAAELDHFLLRKKLGLGQSSQNAPDWPPQPNLALMIRVLAPAFVQQNVFLNCS